jgi:phosphate-selective porin OprO and OprP
MSMRSAAFAGASLLAISSPAFAQQATGTAEDRAAQIADMERRISELEAELARLRESVAAEAAAPAQRREQQSPEVTLQNGRLALASSDGAFRFAVRGLFQYDVASYDQASPETPDNRRSDASNPGDLSSGGVFRRARLGVEGTVYRDWNYAITYEMGGSGVESAQLNQAYLEYAGWKPWDAALRLRIGAWATPTGLEDATSNTESLFLERAASAELVRNLAGGDGRMGVGALINGERWYASAVLTGGTVGNTGEFDEQSGVLTRLAFLPLRGENAALHLGGSISGVIEPADTNPAPGSAETIRLRERPELRVDGQRFVDTGAIPADGVTAFGLEAGGYVNNFYAAGEVFRIDLDRADGLSSPSFEGWYVQGAWTLTGERRRWSGASGGFQGVRPSHAFAPSEQHWGAWELAGRYSVLDLNDNAGAPGLAPPIDGVRGGEQTITSIGLNWYPNNVVRFLLDYQWVEIDRLDPENSSIVTPVAGVGAQIGQDFEALSLRSQVSF